MDYKFVIEKLLDWPFIFAISLAVLLIMFYKPLLVLINNSNRLKIGSFEVHLKQVGESMGIENAIKELNGLSMDELKFFLIVCGEDATYYKFTPTHLHAKKVEAIYNKLDETGLLKVIPVESIPGIKETEKDGFGFKTTEKGRTIHKAFLETIYFQFTNTKIN